MKRLRLKWPFAGYGSTIMLISVLVFSGIWLISAILTKSETSFFMYGFTSIPVTLIISHLWLCRKTTEDRIKMRKSKPVRLPQP